MESSSYVEQQVLATVQSSVSPQRARELTRESLIRTDALIGPDEFHGIVHDLTMDLDVHVGPEEAAILFEQNPTIRDLAQLFEGKIQVTAKAV